MSDKLSMVTKSIQSFLKMYSEETCELIKINYWNSLENAINKSSIEPNEINKLIFQEVFNKNLNIINDKNLTFLIFNFCLTKSIEQNNLDNADNFFFHIYEFLDLILQNFENIFGYVKEYILEYSINLLLETKAEKFDFSETRNSSKFITKYFSDFLEIDFTFFSTYLLSISNQISVLLKNNVFKQIFKKYIKFLLNSSCFPDLIYILNCIAKNIEYKKEEKIELMSYFIELSIKQTNFNQPNNSLVIDEMGKIYFFEILKNSVDLIFGRKQENIVEFSIDIEIFLNLFENYILFIIDNSKTFSALILENNNIFKLILTIINSDENNNQNLFSKQFSRFEKVFPLALLNLVGNINSFSSLEKLGNITNTLKSNSVNIKSKFVIKILQKIFSLNGKIKNFPKSEYFQIENLKIFPLKKNGVNMKSENLEHFEINYKNDVSNLYTVSNLNLFAYIIENSLYENENKIYFNQELFLNFLQIIFSLKFEGFDINMQNEFAKNMLLLIFIIYENLENGLDFSDKHSQQIFEFLFSYLKTNINPEFAVNELYPILIIFFQTILFPKITKLCAEAVSFKENQLILSHYFDFLNSFGRIESIANIISKFLITILNTKGNNMELKIFALEKFVNLVIFSNTAKFYLVYFNHAVESIKKTNLNIQGDNANNQILIKENMDLQNIYFYSLWDLSARYEGSLPFEILNFFTNKFEECVNKLPEEPIKFEHLISIEAIKFIILKDQDENLFDLILQNVLNMKFMKIFDKLFQRSKNLEPNILQFINLFNVDENKINNFELSLKVLFHRNFNNEILKNLSNQTFIYLLLIVFLSRLFSGFLSNLILHNKDKFNIRNFSEQSNSAINSIIKTFDYISASLIFLNDEEKTFPHLLFLNEIFSNGENLNFFYNTHSYITAIEKIEKNNLDYSMLNETNMKIISEKNRNLFFYSKYKDTGIFFLKKSIINLFILEINSFSIIENKNSLNNNLGNNNILNSIYLDNVKNYVITNHSTNKNIASSYLKFFLDSLFNVSEINTAFNKNLYYFCLTEKVFENNMKNCINLLNVDLINVCIYSQLYNYEKEMCVFKENLINMNNPVEDYTVQNDKINYLNGLNKKLIYMRNCFLDYLIKFSKISRSALQFSLRILGNFTTFSKLLYLNCENKLEIPEQLFSLIDLVISTVLIFNSYNLESYDNIVNIIENIMKTADFEFSYLSNLICLGKIISNIFISLSMKIKQDGIQNEINKKLKDQIMQTLQNNFLYSYLEKLLNVKNDNFMELVKKDFEKYFENILIFKNFKKTKLIKEINNEPCIKKFEEMDVFKMIYMITDLNIPNYLHNTVLRLINSYKYKNFETKFIIENFLNYNLSLYPSNKKIAVDLLKNLILGNQDENSENMENTRNSNFTWDDKFKIINLVMFNYMLNDNIFKIEKKKNLLTFHKMDAIKNIIGNIHFNILLR